MVSHHSNKTQTKIPLKDISLVSRRTLKVLLLPSNVKKTHGLLGNIPLLWQPLKNEGNFNLSKALHKVNSEKPDKPCAEEFGVPKWYFVFT